jgi:DNA ligase-1
MSFDFMKAVEYDKLPVRFKKLYKFEDMQRLGYWLQRKYDGCFVKAVVNCATERCDLFSRTGEVVRSMDHVKPALIEMQRHMRPNSIDHAWDNVTFYGEAWYEGAEFPTISGDFRRQSNSPRLQFVVNDAVKEWDREAPYTARHATIYTSGIPMHRPDDWTPTGPVFGALTYRVGEWVGDARDFARFWQSLGGYDGAILRNPGTIYTPGLVKHGEIIKVKPLLSLDLRCIGWNSKPGEKTGRDVYTITVEYRRILTDVGSGMPHNETDVPRPGDIVQIDALGVTTDGKLREPRFIAIRHDKEEPDT